MRTAKEKFEFNKKNKENRFSIGYCFGYNMYMDYVKMDKKEKETLSKVISNFSDLARKGDLGGKSVMCAYRDCAKERKGK